MTSADVTDPGAPWYVFERQRPFSQSLVWQMQRDYYADRGVDAWRDGEVPHYVTSNPTMAAAYADMAFAFYQDRQRLQASDLPLTVCELGAGSGRLAFHFLLRLTELCAQHGVALSAFRYVLTDFAQSNPDAWLAHPRFQSWLATGLLDVALFDVDQPGRLQLQRSGQVIDAGTLQLPLVVVANYVFDSVPSDLHYFRDRAGYECLITLYSLEDTAALDAAGIMQRLRVHYDYLPLAQRRYAEQELQDLLDGYRDTVHDGHILFPTSALRSLAYLASLSRNGMLLLSADKGEHAAAAVARPAPPGFTWHGSFSLNVNYHALLAWCKARGGTALVPGHQHRQVAVVALLMCDDADAHRATTSAYLNNVAGFGPDDYCTLAELFKLPSAQAGIGELMALMRFNRADAYQLAALMPRLTQLAPTLDAADIAELKKMLDRSWDGYFPLGEARDLAFDIGCLLYELNDFGAALHYFERTEDIYGRHTGTLFNRAACHERLGQDDQARALLHAVLAIDPSHAAASALLEAMMVYLEAQAGSGLS